jgi:hypothetical protein
VIARILIDEPNRGADFRKAIDASWCEDAALRTIA